MLKRNIDIKLSLVNSAIGIRSAEINKRIENPTDDGRRFHKNLSIETERLILHFLISVFFFNTIKSIAL